jgi:hypothetical protein
MRKFYYEGKVYYSLNVDLPLLNSPTTMTMNTSSTCAMICIVKGIACIRFNDCSLTMRYYTVQCEQYNESHSDMLQLQ